MGTGDSASASLVISPPTFHPPGSAEEPFAESPGSSEHGDIVSFLASPKFKPARVNNHAAGPNLLCLESTVEVAEVSDEDDESRVQKKPKKGLSKKFMSMSNLLAEVGDEEEVPTHPVGSPPEQFAMEPLHASHRPEPLDHTVGTVKPTLKKSQSALTFEVVSDDDIPDAPPSPAKKEEKMGDRLLVVFDMDRTMVGDLVSLSDRDNIETNIEWSWWPEGQHRGLSVEEIIPYCKRGMIRPGLIKFIEYLQSIGATIVVYTHSEQRWASKVTQAIEEIAGFKFIRKLFSRQDCRDGHPTFPARKSLQYITQELAKEEGLEWVNVERTIMFDDDGSVLGGGDQIRLVRVATYDYWEPCVWNEVVTEELLEKNTPDLVEIVRQSVIEWGVTRPSYGTAEEDRTEEEKEKDERWEAQLKKKQQLQLSYNKVAKLDRLWFQVREAFQSVPDLDDENMETLPVRVRRALGNNAKQMSRR